MQSECIRETSKACFSSCCATNPPIHTPPLTSGPRRDFLSAILSTIHPNTNFTNHESLPSSRELLSSLEIALPNYSNTVVADTIRGEDYYHLSLSKHVCLDYIGHGLFSYAQSQKQGFFDFAYSSTSFISYLLYGGHDSGLESAIKSRILKYMNLLEEDYSVVLTANQSSAFRLLADSYPFNSHQNLLTVYDYENEAAQLMIDAARKRGGRPQSAVFSWPSFRVESRKLRKILVQKKRGLFAFPLQSRMTGSRYSYEWMNVARENGWHVLLDASALPAKEMETLGLSLFQPDFLICSFFKVFGENPSGFCCLFVKKSSVSALDQSSTSMGIINLVPLPSNDNLELELRGLDLADALGLIVISRRVRYLVNWLLNALLSLRHPHSGNGLPLIILYGPRVRLDRGPALAFNVHDWKGEIVDPILVQKLADRCNISLTTALLNQHDKQVEDCGVEVVSASLGMLTDFQDVYRVWAFVSKFLDADFVEKEKWRYTALNQTTVEV